MSEQSFDIILGDQAPGQLAQKETAGSVPINATVIPGKKGATGGKKNGWLAVARGNKVLTAVAAVAILSLGFGLGASGLIMSPAGAAEEDAAPEPGLITVPVAFGTLSNDVTLRADIGFSDVMEVAIPSGGPTSIVTGFVPEVGDELDALSVAIEVTGRPVIVLPGELPAYRDLSIGMSGPDVVQFKEAMRAVGIDAGDPRNDVFDERAANAVRRLYERVGYPIPASSDGVTDAITSAQTTLDSARLQLTDSERALELARQGGPTHDEKVAADIARDRAQEALNEKTGIRQALEARPVCTPESLPEDNCRTEQQLNEARREEQLAEIARNAAQAARDLLERPVDIAAEQRAVDASRTAVRLAEEALASAQSGALPTLPVAEVLFMTSLPRRVDSVNVTRGVTLSGTTFTVSGATLELRGSASASDAALLTVGDEAFFDLPGGGTHRSVIASINQPADGATRWGIEFAPDPLTPEDFAALRGSNVRIQIPVGATAGDVLNVPLAALTAGPGGEARVEVVEGDPRDGAMAATRLVVVETGLAAGGFVEVTPVAGAVLTAGDLVVVGR